MLNACGSGGPEEAENAAIDTGKIHRWKMVTTWPANFPVFQEAPEMFAENVRIMSNGRLDINVFAGGELVPALQVFDAVIPGRRGDGSRLRVLLGGEGASRAVFLNGSLRHGTERCGSLAVSRRRPGAVE